MHDIYNFLSRASLVELDRISHWDFDVFHLTSASQVCTFDVKLFNATYRNILTI